MKGKTIWAAIWIAANEEGRVTSLNNNNNNIQPRQRTESSGGVAA